MALRIFDSSYAVDGIDSGMMETFVFPGHGARSRPFNLMRKIWQKKLKNWRASDGLWFPWESLIFVAGGRVERLRFRLFQTRPSIVSSHSS